MKLPSIGTIGSIALLGGIGYIVYKFYKGDWKLPSWGDLGGSIVSVLPGDPETTVTETGVPGAVGDVIYNIVYPDLRERVQEGYQEAYRETEQLIDITTPPGQVVPVPDPAGVFSRSVAKTTAQDIHSLGPLSFLLPGLSAVTIGAGFGAIARQGQWMETLPPGAKLLAEKEESTTRLTKQLTDPSVALATALMPPIVSIPLAIMDITRASRPAPPRRAAKAAATGSPGRPPLAAQAAPRVYLTPPPAPIPESVDPVFRSALLSLQSR